MSFRELGVAYVVFWVYFNVPHLDTCHFDENPELSRRVEDSVLWCGAWVCSFVPQLAHKQLLLADASQWACCHSVQASRLDPRTRENCESQSDAGACVVWSISLCNCRAPATNHSVACGRQRIRPHVRLRMHNHTRAQQASRSITLGCADHVVGVLGGPCFPVRLDIFV